MLSKAPPARMLSFVGEGSNNEKMNRDRHARLRFVCRVECVFQHSAHVITKQKNAPKDDIPVWAL